MPNIESAKKQQRKSLKRKTVNKTNVSKTRTALKIAEASIASGDLQKAEQDVKAAASALDRAVGKGVVHSNNASRHKSRLEKGLNKAKAASAE
ncbi:MAG: 30S ribosomal protein S20 [Dehalococcoidales bacterium]